MAYKKTYEKTEPKDYQQELTNRFITRLEEIEQNLESGLKWEKPIFTCNEWPVNGFTKEKYHGGNVGVLFSAEKPDPRWFTFNQIQELNKKREEPLMITKGSRAEFIQKVVPVYERDEHGNIKKDENGNYKPVVDENNRPKISFRYYAVFNGADIKGLEPHIKPNLDVKPSEAIEMLVEALKEKDGLKFEHSNGGTPYYAPGLHKVVVPKPEYFKSTEAYHDTLTHELSHSSGKSLGRNQTGKFGDKNYSFEELVAEISSSFMAIELGLKHDPSQHENQLAYIKSWLSALKDDKTMITRASNYASKATEFQMGKLNEYKLELSQKKEQTISVEQTPQERIKFQIDRLDHYYFTQEIHNLNNLGRAEFMKDGIADYIKANNFTKTDVENFKQEYPDLKSNIDEKRIFKEQKKAITM